MAADGSGVRPKEQERSIAGEMGRGRLRPRCGGGGLPLHVGYLQAENERRVPKKPVRETADAGLPGPTETYVLSVTAQKYAWPIRKNCVHGPL